MQRTSKKNRATYIYYSANGKKLMELRPGENGVTEADIAMLHEQDDLEYNAQRRENYLAPVYYDGYTIEEDKEAEDQNVYLSDTEEGPEELLLNALEAKERENAVKILWAALLPQQRELVLMKLKGKTNIEIAANDGVSEAAVRNRLRKIQEKFKAFK
jgi:DNA-binding CsgD family transcriptional regulator